jgi:hypothetical protein
LKEDIESVGELYDGTNVYRYRYKGDDTPRIGVMAQEIAQDRPEAVRDIGGWLAVDYGAATDRAADLARFLDATGGANYDRAADRAGELMRFLEAHFGAMLRPCEVLSVTHRRDPPQPSRWSSLVAAATPAPPAAPAAGT